MNKIARKSEKVVKKAFDLLNTIAKRRKKTEHELDIMEQMTYIIFMIWDLRDRRIIDMER